MSFVCDQEYIKIYRRLYEAITGTAHTDDLTDPGLLAKHHEENMDATDKKSTGTFYTPSEIVRFMCRESLAYHISNHTGLPIKNVIGFISGESSCAAPQNNLLSDDFLTNIDRIDRALADVKIFDPSVGCGAFVLGMVDEIVRLRSSITPYLSTGAKSREWSEQRSPERLSYHTISNSIFAADIDPISVEITKLRLWYRLFSASATDGFTTIADHAVATIAHAATASSPSSTTAYVYSSFKCNIKLADSLFECDRHRFDIIIGNPPYISAVEGAKTGKAMRQALRDKFPQLSGAFDIYTAFLLDGIEKLNENGVYCWLIPNKFLVSQYAAPVLEYLKQNGLMQSISVSDIAVFSKAKVYPVIIIGNKCNSEETRPGDFKEYKADDLTDLSARTFYIKTKPKSYKTFADHNIRIASGAAGFQARLLKKYIVECTNFDTCPDTTRQMYHVEHTNADHDKFKGAIPFVVSGCIDRYSLRYEKVRYMGTTYNKAFITKGKEIADSKWDLWCRSKICIAGLTKEIEAYYSKSPLALGVGTYAVYEFGDFDPLFLLGLINSSFMSWYISTRFFERHLAGRYLTINKSTLEQLPMVQADRQTQDMISRTAEELLGLEPSSPKARQLDSDIDEIVYELYHLTKSDIKAIERARFSG